ncbi:Golgi Transport [Orbilia ellipsospora]|uniref:Golgi Transport n=1 Tax=Orbilia ellipsospora TaxID=2528407 RepID=A0AAV9XND5_9PEZI
MWLSDQQKVGVAFCSGGAFFFTFGIFLFFDKAMLAMGNILFLIGLTLTMGVNRTFLFFARREKWKGTATFALGILVIFLKYPLIGFVIECYGILNLFGDFFGVIVSFLGSIPVIGPYITRFAGSAGRALPV